MEMLHRAESVPLWIDIELMYLRDDAVEAVETALRCLDCISDLRLSFTDTMYEKLLSNLIGPAPILQSLRLTRFPGIGLESARILPSNFLGACVPRLRELELVRCPIQWDSPLFGNLRRLVLVQVANASRPSIEQIIELLGDMHELEDLELENCGPRLPVGQMSVAVPTHVVHLPLLSRLSLSSHALECANLMNHLSFSSDATLRLICGTSTSLIMDITLIFPSVVRWLSSAPRKVPNARGHIEWLRVTQSHEPKLYFLGSSTVVTDIIEPVLPTVPHMKIILCSNDWVFNLEKNDIMVSLCRDLPLPRLQVLDVSVHFTFSSQQWVDAFGSLQQLHTICLRSCAVTPFMTAIAMTKPDGGLCQGSASVPTTFFPGLHSLIFDDADFGSAGEVIFEEFQDVLMFRVECDVAIESLNFRRCINVYGGHIEVFGELVVDVVWDSY